MEKQFYGVLMKNTRLFLDTLGEGYINNNRQNV